MTTTRDIHIGKPKRIHDKTTRTIMIQAYSEYATY